jgi:excisionase family DNA binding protein
MEDMATRALTTTLDPVDPTVRSDAKNLADRLSGDTPVEAAVRAMLDDVAHGARVVVLRAEDEVTPAEAADLLGVTRQFVDRLCEDGVLAFRRLPGSRHRRIRVQDVVDVAAEREHRHTGGDAIRAATGE